MLSNKERYKLFCDEHPEIPLFMQAWWVEAASIGKEWDVLFYEENNRILATFVYTIVKKFGFKFILNPMLSQYSGIWIDYPPKITTYQKLNIEFRVMTNLIIKIENLKFVYLEQNFHHSVTNWLPFYWKNYRQYTRYTYQIPNLKDLTACFENLTSAKRRLIRKADSQLIAKYDTSPEVFFKNVEQNAIAKKQKLLYSKELFMSIYEKSKERHQSKLITAFDDKENMHAGIFLVWDKQTAYYLLSTINQEFKSSGAYTFLMWKAIRNISKKVKVFDFEGSVVQSIEESYRQFGTQQVPYFNISKSKSFIVDFFVRLKK